MLEPLVSCFECVICFLNQYANLLMVIITFFYAVTTWRILKANSDSAKAAQEQLQEQKKQAQENERHYKKTLQQQKEDSRIAQMSFFYLLGSITCDWYDGHLTLRIQLENCGNGSGAAVSVCHYSFGEGYPCVYKNAHLNFPYRYYDILSPDFAKVGDVVEFEILRDTSEDLFSDSVSFAINFQDMIGNKYRQEFTFQYQIIEKREVKVGDHQSHIPVFSCSSEAE